MAINRQVRFTPLLVRSCLAKLKGAVGSIPRPSISKCASGHSGPTNPTRSPSVTPNLRSAGNLPHLARAREPMHTLDLQIGDQSNTVGMLRHRALRFLSSAVSLGFFSIPLLLPLCSVELAISCNGTGNPRALQTNIELN